MKHGFELVIIGLEAMQDCSYLKNQASGNHTTPPNSKHTYSLQKQHKIASCVFRITVCKIRQIQTGAAIQIFLHLHTPNSTILHSAYVTFRRIVLPMCDTERASLHKDLGIANSRLNT